MKRACLAVVFISVIVPFIGCAGTLNHVPGEQEVIERVPGRRPDWVHRVPGDRDGVMYFVGMKTHASSLENGNTDARQASVQKVVEYFGGTGKVDYTKARVESGLTDEGMAGNYIEDGYRFLAESLVSGMRESETYYERVKEWQLDGWHYFYNYYILMNISEEQMNRAAQDAYTRQAADARARNDEQAEAFANRLRDQLKQDASSPNQ